IAIIAILAAILFPVFARAREQARKAACASNLKQIGLAVMQYAQDYDEIYPVAQFRMPPNVSVMWYTAIQPYVKSTQIFVCPTAGRITWGGGYGLNICGTSPLPPASATALSIGNGFGYFAGGNGANPQWCTPNGNSAVTM